jgi:hypothetical protein
MSTATDGELIAIGERFEKLLLEAGAAVLLG